MFITYFVVLFYVTPFIEWSIHRYFHKPPSLEFHKKHHLNFHKNRSVVEHWPIPFMGFFYYFGFFLIFLGILKYWFCHNIIHHFPEIFPTLEKHHRIHHQCPEYNFAVSSTLPDRIMGTHRDRDIPKRIVKL